VLEELATEISRRWLGVYAGLEALPGIIGTAMLGISTAEMVLSTAARMTVLYAWKGPGPWMAAAIWGTAFQVAIMPGRWALEWGQSQGGVIARAMEVRAGGANLPIEGEGTGSNNGN
jgi:ribulose kinase